MKIFILIVLLTVSLAASPATTQIATAQTPVAQVPRKQSDICFSGTFLMSLGSQPLGRETFEIKCAGAPKESVPTSGPGAPKESGAPKDPGTPKDSGVPSDAGPSMKPGLAVTATGNMKMDVGGPPMDLTATIQTDALGRQVSLTIKGTGGGQTLDQVITIKRPIGAHMDDKTPVVATVVNKGQTSEVPYNGGVLFVPNLTFTYQFLLERYDQAKGGPQKIPLFPQGDVTVERTALDEIVPVGIVAGAPARFNRYSLQLGPATLILWSDDKGRVALVHSPAQNIIVVREDLQAFAGPLRAKLAAVKGLAPDYSAAADAPFTAEEVKVNGKDLTLAGTLLMPKNAKGRVPAVVMSTGSGQQTRDSVLNLPGLEQYRPFRQIAEAVAARGIAVLRADDRGVGESTGMSTLSKATTLDFADDVRAQIAYLRSRADIDPDRIAIVGHSEGGIIAPLVAVSDKRVRAIVLLAGTAKRGEDVLRFQLNYEVDNDPKSTAEAREKKHQETEAALRALMQGGADLSKYPPIILMLDGAWTRWFLKYDPLPTIRNVKQPILIVQGGLDQQVTADQATMLADAAKAAGNKDVVVNSFPNLNHLFLPAKTGAGSEYSSLGVSKVPDEVITAIADWLERKMK